jgi:hypothetical protein
VQRILAQFEAQTYGDKELIIFNTDEEFPYTLEVEDPNVVVVNNGRNYLTGEPYKNRGEICRDAVTHATGDYFMLADDDDIYLPWHIQQAVEGIEANGKDSWKPERSFFANSAGVHMVMNTLEASVIVKIERIREIGFRSDLTGYEGLSWYTKLRDEGQLNEHNPEYVPSYCFNWSDPAEIAGHKQSGDINNPDNFENHKRASHDRVTRPLTARDIDLHHLWKKYYQFLVDKRDIFHEGHFNKYALPHLTTLPS